MNPNLHWRVIGGQRARLDRFVADAVAANAVTWAGIAALVDIWTCQDVMTIGFANLAPQHPRCTRSRCAFRFRYVGQRYRVLAVEGRVAPIDDGALAVATR